MAGEEYVHTTAHELTSLSKADVHWGDVDYKIKLLRALMWDVAISAPVKAASSSLRAGRSSNNAGRIYNALANPSTKACNHFNNGKCFTGQEDPESALVVSRQSTGLCHTLRPPAIGKDWHRQQMPNGAGAHHILFPLIAE